MTSVLAVAGLVTVMLTALAGLGVGGRWLWRTARKFTTFVDDWIGEDPRPGLPEGRPGVLATLYGLKTDAAAARAEAVAARVETAAELAALRERVTAIEAQLAPNGGGSLRDAVDRLSATDGAGIVLTAQTSQASA